MAAFAQSRAAARSLSSHKPLPDGACNFRDLTSGPNAPTCGCKRFWCAHDAATTSAGYAGGGAEKPWCVCGHHACFHDISDQLATSSFHEHATSQTLSFSGRLVEVKPGVYVESGRGDANGVSGLAAGSQPTVQSRPEQDTPRRGLGPGQGRVEEATRDRGQQFVCDFATRPGEQASPAGAHRKGTADVSGSGFPNVPSMCLLDSNDLRPLGIGAHTDGNKDTIPQSGTHNLRDPPVRNHPGLGLSMQSTADQLSRVLTPAPFEREGFHKMLEKHQQPNDSQLASTIQYSTDGEDTRPRNSPSRTFMDHVLQARRMAPHLDVPFTVPEGCILPEDVIQSATEVATPSVSNTPDLRAFDQTVHETSSLMEALVHGLAAAEKADAVDDRENRSTKPSVGNTPQASPRPIVNGTPDSHAESVSTAFRSIPLTLRKLAPHLSAFHKHLTAYPNVSTAIQTLRDRVDLLENASFSHVSTDEVYDKFELMDGRLLDVEHRLTDHEQFHAVMDADRSSRESSLIKRRGIKNGSFNSGASDRSISPSAFIAAAIDRDENNGRLDIIEQRLDDLESGRPSYANPWEIDVVLLPWGRELKGIWSTQDELDLGASSISQISEEWTQTFGSRSSAGPPLQLTDSEQTGWSNEEIRKWVGTTQKRLWPRACGPKGMAYQRLLSRGLVRRVTIKEPGAYHIQNTITDAFGEPLRRINESSTSLNDIQSSDSVTAAIACHGLRAPVIPLRKIPKDRQLQILGPAEMVTPSLWDAEFLSSSVIMRAPGGRKRLYVTHSNAILQPLGDEESEWTWARIRVLPRVKVDSDEQNADGVHVGESDGREPCWAYHPSLDPPYSTASSFASNSSLQSRRSAPDSGSFGSSSQLSLRPAFQQPVSQPSGLGRGKAPITPQSEFPTQRPQRRFNRTVSAPITREEALHSKRRLDHSSDDSVADPSNARPSLSYTKKRRRLTRSPTADTTAGAQQGVYGPTPRRSREPASPFFAEAQLSSDVRSQGTMTAGPSAMYGNFGAGAAGGGAVKGASTPLAYATPHSGTMATGDPWADHGGGDTEPDSLASDVDGDGEDETVVVEDDDENKEMEASSWDGVDDDVDADADAGADASDGMNVKREACSEDGEEGKDSLYADSSYQEGSALGDVDD